MSLRRPKMQVKPKLSGRSLTPKANSDSIRRQSVDLSAIPTDSTVKGPQIQEPLSDSTDNPVMQLTTRVIPVVVNETNEDNNSNGLMTKTVDLSQVEAVVDEVLVEETNQTIGANESNLSEIDSKQQKASETKSKPKTDPNRKRKVCRNTQKSDKTIMRMKDLLLYNPPMTDEQKEMRDKDVDQSEKTTEDQPSEDAPKGEAAANDSDESNAGPRVKVGTDGLLILDEESVVVKRHKPDSMNESPLLESAVTTSALTNYSSFRSRTKGSSKPRWTEHETIRFYSALNTIGTDFTLMANLFFRGKRTRLDLRNKFKKEERINKLMIDEALFSPNTFINQCPELDDLLGDSSDSDEDSDENSSIKQKSSKSKV